MKLQTFACREMDRYAQTRVSLQNGSIELCTLMPSRLAGMQHLPAAEKQQDGPCQDHKARQASRAYLMRETSTASSLSSKPEQMLSLINLKGIWIGSLRNS